MATTLEKTHASFLQSADPLNTFESGTPCTALIRNNYGYYIPWQASVIRETPSGKVTVRIGDVGTRTVTKAALFMDDAATARNREVNGPNVNVWRMKPNAEPVFAGTLRDFCERFSITDRLQELKAECGNTGPDVTIGDDTYRVFIRPYGIERFELS